MKVQTGARADVMLPLSLVRAGENLLESLFPVRSTFSHLSGVTVGCAFVPRVTNSRQLSFDDEGFTYDRATESGINAIKALSNVSTDVSQDRVANELSAGRSSLIEQSPEIERRGLVEVKSLFTLSGQPCVLPDGVRHSTLEALFRRSSETRYLLLFSNGLRKEFVRHKVNLHSFAAVHFDFAVGIGRVRFEAPAFSRCLVSVAEVGRPAD